ncbi:hypothetical protein [Stutzerimonas stutzeri]|uniref:hypothetical protein n=1 Tax=Stutzerimonas stutzeri TaxID=316 RepID=UPI0005EBE0E3|nr:hypothetical protein [Stutzerimonas stutzeri]
MPAGLQTWFADGSIQLDTTRLVGRILGVVSVPAGQASGSVSHPGFAQGTPFAIPLTDFSQNTLDLCPALSIPQVSFSGQTMTWSRQVASGESTPAGVIYYGVY